MEQAELLKVRRSRNQRGMSILETIVGLLVLTIVMVTAGELFRVQVLHLALAERARLADTQANNALNQFAAYNQSALPDCNPYLGMGPSNQISDGTQLQLDSNVCATAYACDEVIKVPQSTGTGYDYVVIAWNQTLPAGGTLAYYRAWRVSTLDTVRHLRRITIAILPADLGKNPGDPVEPLALRTSDVVQRQ